MTTALLDEIEDAVMSGETDGEIAARLGLSRSTVQNYRQQLDLEGNYPGRPPKMYTINDAATGCHIVTGTVEECADTLGTSKRYIHKLFERARTGKLKKYSIEFD